MRGGRGGQLACARNGRKCSSGAQSAPFSAPWRPCRPILSAQSRPSAPAAVLPVVAQTPTPLATLALVDPIGSVQPADDFEARLCIQHEQQGEPTDMVLAWSEAGGGRGGRRLRRPQSSRSARPRLALASTAPRDALLYSRVQHGYAPPTVRLRCSRGCDALPLALLPDRQRQVNAGPSHRLSPVTRLGWTLLERWSSLPGKLSRDQYLARPASKFHTLAFARPAITPVRVSAAAGSQASGPSSGRPARPCAAKPPC